MEHKAFVLDYENFASELRGLIEGALRSGDVGELRQFVECHRDKLVDPYEGELLGEDWEAAVVSQDPHQYGDFALTLYYDPCADIGLGCEWEDVQGSIVRNNGPGIAVLGSSIASGGMCFDPGKMGSYFQSPCEVRQRLEEIRGIVQAGHGDERCVKAADMLEAAERIGKGLYVTF